MSRHRHTLRHQLTLARWSFRSRGWHPRAKRLARLRHLYWTLVRWHETEICNKCGGPVGLAWHAPDDLWLYFSGLAHPPHGQLCSGCFSEEVRHHTGKGIFWTCSQDPSILELIKQGARQ